MGENKKMFFGVLESGELEFLRFDENRTPISVPFKFVVESSVLETWLKTLVAFEYISDSPRVSGVSIGVESKKISIVKLKKKDDNEEKEDVFSFSIEESLTLLRSLLAFSNPLVWGRLRDTDTESLELPLSKTISIPVGQIT